MDIPQPKYARRTFYFTVSSVCLLLVLIEFVILPITFGAQISPIQSILDKLLLSLITSIVSATLIGTVLVLLIPPAEKNHSIEIIASYQRSEALEEARSNTQIWWFSGGLGRYNRAVTIPDLAKRARASNSNKAIFLQLLDPDNIDVCARYARLRLGLRSGRSFQWTAKQVRLELLSTITSAYCWQHEEPLLDITIALKSHCSLFRVDLGSELALVTTEDPKDPAMKCIAGSFYYNTYREDLRVTLAQSRELPKKANDMSFSALNGTTVQAFIAQLGLRAGDLEDADFDYIAKTARKPEDPYE